MSEDTTKKATHADPACPDCDDYMGTCPTCGRQIPEPDVPWLTTADIAERFENVSLERVDKIAIHIGLRHGCGHTRLGESVRTEYSSDAVALIVREIRSRGGRLADFTAALTDVAELARRAEAAIADVMARGLSTRIDDLAFASLVEVWRDAHGAFGADSGPAKGALLDLVREAWGSEYVFVHPPSRLDLWTVLRPDEGVWGQIVQRDTELEALVAALEAAP